MSCNNILHDQQNIQYNAIIFLHDIEIIPHNAPVIILNNIIFKLMHDLPFIQYHATKESPGLARLARSARSVQGLQSHISQSSDYLWGLPRKPNFVKTFSQK